MKPANDLFWGRCAVPAPDVSRALRRWLVCQGSVCQAAGGVEARLVWQRRARSANLGTVAMPTACLAMCRAAPVAVLYPDGAWFGRARARRIGLIWAAVESGTSRDAPGFLYRPPDPEAPDGG